ncbi:polysaccharide biosynthesis protein [Alcanivorax xiamenensis]|uniref:Polysaccharide biosynthesis protein n=1 Tax=Alcanivorax xiamenensis TaxID=1177156 RepID=A0ABQ6Y5X6_9GAMM|nr:MULTISPECIES: UDP-2,4-diacetamido-2,4,6-trideoxy-beta-L-altropyranose hydrolase [Alcanivorax]KAF0804705.1 polysaccharide biosynthesis protein [Alcanivorax xiamenensis]
MTALSVVFRADASLRIGSGHVMRCLTLAAALQRHGAEIHFLCRDLPGHLGARIQQAGHRLTLLPAPTGDVVPAPGAPAHAAWLGVPADEDARDCAAALAGLEVDWLVVDHYALDQRWEGALRDRVGAILAIDDLADRRHDVDVLLDQNLGRRVEDYHDLLPTPATPLIGPRFALLRPEFAQWRQLALARRDAGLPERILVSLGGTDPDNVTSAVLATLSTAPLPASIKVDVVMGASAPGLVEVRERASTVPFECSVEVNVTDMARRLCEADLAIGAAGGSAWERCCLGLPTWMVVLADNQRPGARALVEAGAAMIIGDVTERPLRIDLPALDDPVGMLRMARAASALCDGLGAERVAQHMVGPTSEKSGP